MTTDHHPDLTRRLDDLDARLDAIEAAHDHLMRLLSTVPTRCRAPGCAHLAYAALCPTHSTTPINPPQPSERVNL